MPIYANCKPGRWLGPDRPAGHRLDGGRAAFALVGRPGAAGARHEPDLREDLPSGAMQFEDASTDDARPVLRLCLGEADRARRDAVRNYTRSHRAYGDGRVCVECSASDTSGGRARDIDAGVVVNATGRWGRGTGAAGAPAMRAASETRCAAWREPPADCA